MIKGSAKYYCLLILFFTTVLFAQSPLSLVENGNPLKHSKSFLSKSSASSVMPLSIGIAAILYVINPILIYEDKHIFAGITKEISVGWGKFGEHRTAFEYSFILGGNVRHFIRFSYKYDFLLQSGLQPSHMLQAMSTVSFGAGYFNDFSGGGLFPELTYGYSIRNHKLLFYPHVKIRHTFMLKKEKSDITDISAGLMIGFANPFIDVDIRRKY